MNKIKELADQLLADDDENELSYADAKLLATSQFEPVYDSVELSEAVRIAELTEARKTISRRKAKFDEDKPRFLGYILSRLSENAKYKLKSQPNYSKARDEEDLVAIWKMIEEKHGASTLMCSSVRSYMLLGGDQNLLRPMWYTFRIFWTCLRYMELHRQIVIRRLCFFNQSTSNHLELQSEIF